jgi:eukaryotic-like serine/threonine-protein kinase
MSDDPQTSPAGDEPAKPATGQQIPGYKMLAKLGAGAMAVVFKARQLSLNRDVAIKVLPKKLSQDAEYVERFYAEGRAAAKLNHPNIVQAYDVGEAQGYHYFVMEYVEGKTVYDELAAGKVYSEAEALNIILQMARALDHAHSQGLIHRDVKPKNIMLTTGGLAKLMDMGLARAAADESAIAAEQGKLYGTPYYISPEQILGKADVDFRCDIYSLGATFYHMITGQVPFDGEDSKAVMVKHVKAALPAPDRINIDISFGTVKVIQKMMRKKPSNRHASTAELLDDLKSIDFLLEVEDGGTRHDEPLPDLSAHMAEPDEPAPAKSAPSREPAARPETVPTPPPAPVATRTPTWLIVALITSVLLNVALAVLAFLR